MFSNLTPGHYREAVEVNDGDVEQGAPLFAEMVRKGCGFVADRVSRTVHHALRPPHGLERRAPERKNHQNSATRRVGEEAAPPAPRFMRFEFM